MKADNYFFPATDFEATKRFYADVLGLAVKFDSEPFHIQTGWAVEFEDPSGNRLGITDYKA